MQTSSTPRLRTSVSTPSQYLGALAPRADPQAQDVPLAVHRDADGAVHGPVGDLAVANLDHDGVDEDHRIDAVQRPVLPVADLAEDPVGDLRDRLPGDRCRVHLSQMGLDLAGRQALRGE